MTMLCQWLCVICTWVDKSCLCLPHKTHPGFSHFQSSAAGWVPFFLLFFSSFHSFSCACFSRSTVVLFYLEKGHVQNCCLNIRYRSSSKKKRSREVQKAYRLCPIVPLSFTTGVSLKQLSMKISILFISFVLVAIVSDSSSSSCLSHITQKVYCVCEYETYQRIALLMEIIPACLELHVNYDWWVMASKLSQKHFLFSFRQFFSFSCINCGHCTNILATPEVLSAYVTGCDKFTRNWLCVRNIHLSFSLST